MQHVFLCHGLVFLTGLLTAPTKMLAQDNSSDPPPAAVSGDTDSIGELAGYERHALTSAGDPERGRELFLNDRTTKCGTCHRVDGKGGQVGPDLSSIGGKFDRPHLIESLLEPSRQIVEGYRTSVIVTVDGQILTGIVKKQSVEEVTIADANGKERTIATADIDQRMDSSVSLMPKGLAGQLTEEQFTDVVAYLEGLRPGEKERMGASVVGPLSLPKGFDVRTVATGLSGATALEVLPDGRVLVCEQTGKVRVVENGTLIDEPFVSLPVDSYWERGVIGVTYHPEFPQEPYIYVCWVAKEPYPHHRVSRFTAKGNVAVPGSEKLLLVGDDQTKMGGKVPAGHQGGALHFGADGKLYISIGEQTAGLPSQKLDTFLGKLLRINPDGSIPDDNPFVGEAKGKYRAIWARGARNPFTFAVRESDGLMLINDVGGVSEEINIGRAGANYGWPVVEHGDQKQYRTGTFDGPIHWYPQSSINGGDFCRTGRQPANEATDRDQREAGKRAPSGAGWPKIWRGRFFFADFVQGWIKTLDPDNPKDIKTFGTAFRRPVDLRFAPDGSLYVLLRNAWVIDQKFEGETGSLLQILYRGMDGGQVSNLPSQDHSEKRQAGKPALQSVFLTEDIVDESAGGLPAFRIETPAATYFLEKTGGGLSSLVDRDGNDWIGFHPEKGSGAGGEYRGIPNAVHKQAGSFFHAKNAATDPSKTRVERVSADYVSIVAESERGHWASRYEFFPTHCTFTITRMPSEHKYWVLYEGTPGGEFNRDDWWMTSAISARQPMTKRHEGDIPAPEWIAFGDARGKRSLVLLHHDDDGHPDGFYQMQNKMTVFGFGRLGLKKFQSSVGRRFSIGLVDGDSHSAISRFVKDMLATSKSPFATAVSTGPNIDLWYGDRQRFGHNGIPQRWVNVLGRVTPAEYVRLTYSLNDEEPKPLSVGPDYRRLAEPGDFNVELDSHNLRKGSNVVVITASYPERRTVEKTVDVVWAPKRPHELPLRIDWQSADSIQDVAQVVDGRWEFTPRGVRVVEPYYDRAIAIGDKSWTDYEVTVPVTFHGLRRPTAKDGGRNVIHAAVAVRWPGHDDVPKPKQPRVKWHPLGATAEFMIEGYPRECRWRIIGDGKKFTYEETGRKIELNRSYMLKHRVESVGDTRTIYRVKFWEASQPEPDQWNVTAEEDNDVPSGGALLLAHYSVLTFGNVTVTPIHGHKDVGEE